MLRFPSAEGDKLTGKSLPLPEVLLLCALRGVLVCCPGLLLSFPTPAHKYRVILLVVQKKKKQPVKYLHKHLGGEKKQVSSIHF